MAPFSICSKCSVKTRKIVKDPITLKMIYLCPLCFKGRNQPQDKPTAKDKNGKVEQNRHKMSKEETIKKADEPAKCSESISQTKMPMNKKSLELEQKKCKSKIDCLNTEANTVEKIETKRRVFKAPLPPPIQKITPPVMQTVIINGRKYVAISESADD